MFIQISLGLVIWGSAAAMGQKISPCPHTFTYTSGTYDEGKWYGQINLHSEQELTGIFVRIKLDRPVEALVNWFGESTTRDNQEFTIKDPQYKLVPGPPISLRFYVKYKSSRSEPNLTGIWLNGRSICTRDSEREATEVTATPYVSMKVTPADQDSELREANKVGVNSDGTRHTIDLKLTRQPQDNNDYFSGDFPLLRPQNSETVKPPPRVQTDSVECGTVTKKPAPLITSGFGTQEGEWPWHIAIYRSEGIQLTYICGGNLLSPKYVLTAAHCVTRPRTVKPSNLQGLLLYLGAHNLRRFGPGIQVMQIADIIVNPEYNSVFYHNDLALLKLSRSADITDYVRPICLWEGDTGLEAVVGRLGTVVGWGFDETKKVSESLMQAKMPVVAPSTCIYSNPDFFSRFTSETSYCAGFRNGTSVCNGDSGGGMTFLKENTGRNRAWHLRGIVSISLPLQGQTVCDPSHYIIFADVAKHLDWIREEISK